MSKPLKAENKELEEIIKNLVISGSNYIKLCDGTLIQWGNTTLNKIGVSTEGDYKRSVESIVNLQTNFKDTSYQVVCSHFPGSYFASVMLNCEATATNQLRIQGYFTDASGHADSLKVHFLAVGKWK